jgi:hypothetical protein
VGIRLGNVVAYGADVHSRSAQESQRNIRSSETSRSCIGNYPRQ